MFIIELVTNVMDNLYYKSLNIKYNRINVHKCIHPALTNFKRFSTAQRHNDKIDKILKQSRFTIIISQPYGYIIKIKNRSNFIVRHKGCSLHPKNIIIKTNIQEVSSLKRVSYNFDSQPFQDIKFTKKTTPSFCKICGLSISGIPHLSKLGICAFCVKILGEEANKQIQDNFTEKEILEIKRQSLIQKVGG